MKYTFERNWSGYSRGIDTIEVEADSLEEAKDKVDYAYAGEYERNIVRDDTDKDDWELVD